MAGETAQQPLAGQRIWLTRPAHQARDWAAGLEAAGARVDVEPLLEIVPPADEADARTALAAAENADVVVAASPNAVHGAWRLRPGFAPTGTLCAVGDSTARVFERNAGRAVQVPEQRDTSEALLAVPALSAVAGRHVVLLAGEGGRAKLKQALAERGARVSKAAVYRRQLPGISERRLKALITGNDAAVITSGEALTHLCQLVHACAQTELYGALARLQLVVPSPRVVQLVPDKLFQRPPRVVVRMTVDAVVAALAPGTRAPDNSHL